MGMTAARLRERRAAALAGAPRPTVALTVAQQLELRDEECRKLRAKIGEQAGQIAELGRQIEALTAAATQPAPAQEAKPSFSQPSNDSRFDQGKNKRRV